MRNFLDYIYFRFYDFLTIFKSYDIYFAVIHVIALLQVIMIIALVPLNSFFSTDVLYKNAYWGSIAYLVLIGINYLLFLRKKRYLQIIAKFEKESKRVKVMGRISVVVSIAILWWLFIK